MTTKYKLKKEKKELFPPVAGTEADQLAEKYVGLLEEQQELDERKNEVAGKLIEAMQNAGRLAIKLRGRRLSVKVTAAKIKIGVTKA
jgi:hypothetical protein